MANVALAARRPKGSSLCGELAEPARPEGLCRLSFISHPTAFTSPSAAYLPADKEYFSVHFYTPNRCRHIVPINTAD